MDYSRRIDFPWERDPALGRDVFGYGQTLGMQLFGDERDRELMSIAFDALRECSVLPDGWERDTNDKGFPYYWSVSALLLLGRFAV